MLGTLKKRKSDRANISQRLYTAIYEKVTRKTHKYESPQEGDGTLTKCMRFFKDGADPEVLSGLAESLSKQIESEKLPKKKEEYQKYYKYYIKTFLPALETEVMASLEPFKLPVFNKEAKQQHRAQTIRGKILKIISGITNGGNDKSHPNSTIQSQGHKNSGTNSKKELERLTETSKPRDDLCSRANPSAPLNEKSRLSSPVSGRRSSISITSSSIIVDNDLQREKIEDQPQSPKQNPEAKLKKQENENLKPTKQPNNRNFRIIFATCYALSVGCLIAGAVTLGIVGAGLFVMSVVFAIAAAVTRYLPPPSSKLTSTDLIPLTDNSKQR